MNLKVFLIIFAFIYISISLPAILGIGYVIDWLPEATWYQKFKGHVVDGLLNDILLKVVISSIVGIVAILVISKRHHSK